MYTDFERQDTVAIAFTGVSKKKLTEREKGIVAQAVRGIKGSPDLFYSGAARGVDTWAAWCALQTFPSARHCIVIPAWREGECRYDRAGVDYVKTQADRRRVQFSLVALSKTATSEEQGYLLRDDVLAVNCTHMLAFPNTAQEQRRSGTWATVRRARKRSRPVRIVPLDGSRGRVLR